MGIKFFLKISHVHNFFFLNNFQLFKGFYIHFNNFYKIKKCFVTNFWIIKSIPINKLMQQ